MTDKNNQPKFSDLDKWDDLFDEHLDSDVNVKRALTNLYNGLQRRGIPQSATMKANLSAARTGTTQKIETKVKISVILKDKPKSEEHKAKISSATIGIKKQPRDEETKSKIGAANKGKIRIRVTCPHCDKEGAESPMARWHFDNCKLKRD